MSDQGWAALAVHGDDDVAVALRDLAAGETIGIRRAGATMQLTVRDVIPLVHNLALHELARGALVRKYGECIGEATRAIAAGSHVHVHNLVSRRGRTRA